MKGVGCNPSEATTILADSQGAIALTKNPQYHSRTKHIDIQYHFVRQHVNNNEVTFKFISTQNMVADVLTKSIPKFQHQKLIMQLGLNDGNGTIET